VPKRPYSGACAAHVTVVRSTKPRHISAAYDEPQHRGLAFSLAHRSIFRILYLANSELLAPHHDQHRGGLGGLPRGAQAWESTYEFVLCFQNRVSLGAFQGLLVPGCISLWSLHQIPPCSHSVSGSRNAAPSSSCYPESMGKFTPHSCP
jgi:hypothetical protein